MTYRRYALERVGSAVVLFWVALTGIYLMFHVFLKPGPPSLPANESFEERLDAYLEETYSDFLVRVLWDRSVGESFFYLAGGPSFLDALAPTVSLILFSLLFASLLAIPLGIACGRSTPGRLTTPMRALSAVMFGVSLFSIALALVYWVGHKWSLLPLGGYCDLVNPATDCGGPADWIRALILPGVSLGFFFGAVYVRVVSALVRGAGRAQKRGDDAARRRAWLSYAKLLGRDFGFAIGLAVVTEAIFGLPGLARMFLVALDGFDPPLMEGALIVAMLLAMSVNLAVDLAVAAADSSFRRF